jgi:hypothetical protein
MRAAWLSLALVSAVGSSLPSPMAMPWLCLERCGQSPEEVEANVRGIAAGEAVYHAVSTERYNLGANSTLIRGANLTDSVKLLRSLGSNIPIHAMVSSYPYPPQFASWMRQVFANPEPFFDALLNEATAFGLAGFNIDWEPTSDVEPGDDAKYAEFLASLGKFLAPHGVAVSVDIASWSPLWNYSVLASVAVPHIDGVMLMSTYTDLDKDWYPALDNAVAAFGASGKLVVGLETFRANGTAYPMPQLAARFEALKQHSLHRVGLWRAPVPADWDSLLTGL